MYTRKALLPLTLLVLLALFTLGGWLVGDRAPDALPHQRQDPDISPYSFLLSADQAIQMYQDRVKADPTDPSNHVLLGQMHMRKARATGRLTCYEPAAASIRQALKLDPNYLSGQACLALIHCANHQFADGLRLAQALCKKHPDVPVLALIVADAHLELGNYAEAERAYQELRRRDPRSSLAARQSRLAELKGDRRQALELMRQAAAEERQARLSSEGGAWFQVRLGDLHWGAGRLGDAARHYQAARQSCADCAPALAGLGQVRAAQGKLAEAEDLYAQAAKINRDCHTLAALGDVYAKTGKNVLAEILFDQLDGLAAQNQGAFNRELSLFYSNHDRKLPQALDLAKKDLAVRQDIYAYDTLAWALYKNKRYEEAAQASAAALKLGTQDANLEYHAGMIYCRLGQTEKARGHLERALALNPQFSLLFADDARRTKSGGTP